METIKEVLSNGNTIEYKIVNGTSYHINTADEVVNVLEDARQKRIRLRVYYGDVTTGKNWNEENNVFGYVGRSTGSIKIPLLVAKENSYGGGALLDHCIIKIRESKGNKVLYQAKNFQQSAFEIRESEEKGYTHSLYIEDILYSNHKSLSSAKLLKKKLS